MAKKLKLMEAPEGYTHKSIIKEAPEDLENIENRVDDNVEAQEDLEDTLDSEVNQEENPVEEESELDKQLNELRDILIDLDLNLYQVTSKEDTNNSIYIVGKVSESNNDTLMLIDKEYKEEKSEELATEVIESDEEKDKSELEKRYDFITLPKSFDEINKLNPRYGEDLSPDHESLVEYLMNCLIEINPDAAEELQSKMEDESEPTEIEPEIDVEEELEDEE